MIHECFRAAKNRTLSNNRISSVCTSTNDKKHELSEILMQHNVLNNLQRNATAHNHYQFCIEMKKQYFSVIANEPTDDHTKSVAMFNSKKPVKSQGTCRGLSESSIADLKHLMSATWGGNNNSNIDYQRRGLKRPACLDRNTDHTPKRRNIR